MAQYPRAGGLENKQVNGKSWRANGQYASIICGV